MKEKLYASVEKLFKEQAPDLLEFLESDDPFWKQVKDNSITDAELDGHQMLMEELGMFDQKSAVAKAVQVIKEARKKNLPTPLSYTF